MFWVLHVGQDQLGLSVITPSDISCVLRDAYGIDVSRQRIEATLSAEKGTVAKRSVGKRRAYQLMVDGLEELGTASSGAHFIDPEQGFSGLREVQGVLGEAEGELRLCDPYLEVRTLDMIAECKRAKSIRLLTQHIKRPDGLRQVITAFEREHKVTVEVRKAPAGVLHDRYLIHDNGMLMFGTSLNGLGLKQSLVVALGADIRGATLAAFEATWDRADVFWPDPR